MRNINLVFKILLLFLLFISCDKNEMQVNKIQLGLADKNIDLNQSLLNDLSAYSFKDSILTKVYSDLKIDENGKCQVDQMPQSNSKLYFLANIGESINLPLFNVGTTTEDEFLQIEAKASPSPNIENPFLMGTLDPSLTEGHNYKVTLYNSISRIDLTTLNTNVIIENIEIKGFADRSFVYKQNPVKSPTGTILIDVEQNYSPGITGKYQGIFYAHEQQGGQTIIINTLVEGIKDVLVTKLPNILDRNHSYNIEIFGDGASVEIRVVSNWWEDSNEVNTTPDLTNDVKIDLENSIFSHGVSVSKTLDTLFLPYYNSSSKLALAASPELEVSVSGAGVRVSPFSSKTSTDYVTNTFNVSFEHTFATNPVAKYAYLHIKDKESVDFSSSTIVIKVEKNQNHFTGFIADYFVGLNCVFDSYMDGDIGTLTVIEGATVSVESSDNWIRSELIDGETAKYTIRAGYRPNDPNAKGEVQTSTITVTHGTGDNLIEDHYVVSRKNFGLPVVDINGKYWCMYNLQGNARSFSDQILTVKDDLFEYLKTCSDVEFAELMGDGYKGTDLIGMNLKSYDIPATEEGGAPTKKFSFENYSNSHSYGYTGSIKTCPDGYMIPERDDLDKIFTYFNNPTPPHSWTGPLGPQEMGWFKKDGLMVDGRDFGNDVHVYYTKSKTNDTAENPNPKLVLYGLGYQEHHMDFKYFQALIVFGNTGRFWGFFNNKYCSDPQGNHVPSAGTTRYIRCVKEPGFFVY